LSNDIDDSTPRLRGTRWNY